MIKVSSHETFLKKFLNDSLRQESHLKSFKWNRERTEPIGLKPLSRKPIVHIESRKLEPLDVIREMRGEFNDETLFLSFDSGILRLVEAIPFMFKDRKKTWRDYYRFGWAGQYAYTDYLNFFSLKSKFQYRFDNAFSTSYNLLADVHIHFLIPKEYDFWVEIKTALPKRESVRYFLNPYNPYPEYVVCVKALNEHPTEFEFYGYCHGSDVKKLDLIKLKGYSCHEIPLDRNHFKPYSIFHEKILKLPFLESFNDEHY